MIPVLAQVARDWDPTQVSANASDTFTWPASGRATWEHPNVIIVSSAAGFYLKRHEIGAGWEADSFYVDKAYTIVGSNIDSVAYFGGTALVSANGFYY